MRQYSWERVTKETKICVSVNLDGTGQCHIDSGIGFFDHMLTAVSVHSGIDLDMQCIGDMHVDCHHTIEDAGIAMGVAFRELTKEKESLARYGFASIPMDEALASCAIDLCGRPYLIFNGEFAFEKIGSMNTQMIREFFYAFALNAGVTLHINLQYGVNDHHKAEAIFKAFAHALGSAIKLRKGGSVLSTKGILE